MATDRIASVATDRLLAELQRRSVLLHCGYAYPVRASYQDRDAEKLIAEDSYAYGPWQLLEPGDPLAQDPYSWPVFACVPEKFRRPRS